MIGDRDLWQAALLMVKRYGDDAMLETAQRADQLLEDGDMAGAGVAADLLVAGRFFPACRSRQPFPELTQAAHATESGSGSGPGCQLRVRRWVVVVAVAGRVLRMCRHGIHCKLCGA